MTKQTFQRREQRYLVADVNPVIEALADLGFESAAYTVRTIYLESADASRLRLREYDGSGVWWLEHKVCNEDIMVKTRHNLGAVDVWDLEAVLELCYHRIAHERGPLRITVDNGLKSGAAGFAGYIVEVKSSPAVQGALPPLAPIGLSLPNEDRQFSKFRWATGRYNIAVGAMTTTEPR